MTEQAKARGWGSLLSGAVAGLESRLDVILADDPEASARSRLADKEKKEREQKLRAEREASRTPSRNRANDRLQARLAQAVGKSADGSAVSSSRSSADVVRTRENGLVESDVIHRNSGEQDAKANLEDNSIVIPTMKEPTPLPESEPMPVEQPEKPTIETLPAAQVKATTTDEELLLPESQDALEKIDALHSKVLFLSSQLYSNASSAAKTISTGDNEQRLAEQEAKIAQLMQEGEKLSHDQLKYSQAIKVLRSRVMEQERLSNDLRKKVEKSEVQAKELQEQLKASQTKERSSSEKAARLVKAEKELSNSNVERNDALERIKALMKDLREADTRASDAIKDSQSGKLNEQTRLIADLRDELSNARIEKKLVEDRAKSDLKERNDIHTRELDKSKSIEAELRSEVQGLESKLEVLRVMSEEVSSNTTSDAQAKLLRQIETLQTQYSNANDNWQTLESTLTNRVTALEIERDELAKREADGRKKSRETTSKARRLEEDLEVANDKGSALETQIAALQSTASRLEAKLKSAEEDIQSGKYTLEQVKKEFALSLNTRLDEERKKIQTELLSPTYPPDTPSDIAPSYIRNDSFPTATQRKVSTTDPVSSKRSRMPSTDFSALVPAHTPESTPRLAGSRRLGSARVMHHSNGPSLSGKHSLPSPPLPMNGGATPPTTFMSDAPSIRHHDEEDDDLPSRDSPQRTIAELMSVSTAGAGPSVQLVERMSATVRRLEMEKAVSRDSLARLKGERDEAREEIVSMMREVDGMKANREKVLGLESQLQEMQGKFDAVLEMLGEKTERCEDLENDVRSWKSLYHQHLDSTTK